jgi:hypothetical protein
MVTKRKGRAKQEVNERKYFAKQIVSFRFCGEIKPVLRYSSDDKVDDSCQKVGAYRDQTYNERK